ncbi:protein kinase [Streptomyces sp. Ru87]|uniref:serine/threonine-protein kinase n=1 Tax=Streptomyces sp. Ru87 TaxID=2044307 RepID=UPI000BF4A1EE|nr:protein kinase [Streptomyces sp. Ru87]PGH50201.1 serine/threonine protein kinase [Streptomyces sp. Ru87]
MDGQAGYDLSGSGAEPLEGEDPRRIGPIPLLGRLGTGGMGRVYLGVHEGRFAAVKQLLPSFAAEDKDFLRRFGHELDNLGRLPEGATAPLLAGDRDARPPWFATAYVPGLTLAEALEVHGGPLPVEALWFLLREAAAGLAAVHGLDMVHRDVKPSNVMLTSHGVTLIDFGVARAAEQSKLTRTGMVIGTPAYMSPEQASGRPVSTGAVDVFALGSVMAYAATGTPPFGDEAGLGTLFRIVHEAPDLAGLRSLDGELADVVAACLDKDPEGRPTAAELVESAGRHGPFTRPVWPGAVSGPLAERAAFVAHVPDATELPVPQEPEPSEPTEPSAPAPVVAGGRPEKRERRRRTRMLAVVIPVVVTGATLSFTLLPNVLDKPGDDSGALPAVSGPATASGTADPTASDGASASPDASDSGDPDDRDKDKDKSKDKENEEGDRDAGAGSGGSGDAGSGSGSDSGDSSGSGDGSGSGSGSGSSGVTSGAGGSGDGGSDDGGAGSGSFMLKNGSSGKCLAVGGYPSVDDAACSGESAVWRFRSTSGGAFRMLNVGAGRCMWSRSQNAWVNHGPCGSGAGEEWREGPNGSLRSVTTGGCLDLNTRASRIGLTTTTCTGSSSQRWTRI